MFRIQSLFLGLVSIGWESFNWSSF